MRATACQQRAATIVCVTLAVEDVASDHRCKRINGKPQMKIGRIEHTQVSAAERNPSVEIDSNDS